MTDPRSPLPKEAILCIQANGASMSFVIEDVIGCGGSCIVYRAKNLSGTCDNKFFPAQIIKEFYPLAIDSIIRNDHNYNLDMPECDRSQFDALEENFCNGISKYAKYYEMNSNHVNARPFLYGTANGTSYAVSDPNEGKILSNFDKTNLTLYNIAQIMYSVCSAIQKFHDHDLLYLDCKPDNIFLRNIDKQYHIQLFDFDTVTSISDIKTGKCEYKTYSQGWAPGEQKYWRVNDIGRETDIYSVGAVFLYLFTGEKPTEYDIFKIEKEPFSWCKRFHSLENASKEAIQIVQKILKNTLQSDPSSRFRDISQLKEYFQELKSLTYGNSSEDVSIYVGIEEINKNLQKIEQRIEQPIEKTKGNKTSEKDNEKRLKAIAIIFAVVALAFICFTCKNKYIEHNAAFKSKIEWIHIEEDDKTFVSEIMGTLNNISQDYIDPTDVKIDRIYVTEGEDYTLRIHTTPKEASLTRLNLGNGNNDVIILKHDGEEIVVKASESGQEKTGSIIFLEYENVRSNLIYVEVKPSDMPSISEGKNDGETGDQRDHL